MSRRPTPQPLDYPVIAASTLLDAPAWVCIAGPYDLPRETEMFARSAAKLRGTKWTAGPFYPYSHDLSPSRRTIGHEPGRWGLYRHITEIEGDLSDEDVACD